MGYISFRPDQCSEKDLHQFIIASISPRPIAFVSTVDNHGNANLAPYSFFNAFSSNPPIVVFSSNLKHGDSPQKDTLLNIQRSKSCVINVVSHEIYRQAALCSVEFPHGVSEFKKSGLTPLDSEIVSAFRVKESPVQIECTLNDIIALGKKPGAANLIICEIVKMHIKENIMDPQLRRIDPQKLDIMGRLGRSNYVRVNGDNILSAYQAVRPLCVGYDQLPLSIKKSRFFTGNDLGRFAALYNLPSNTDLESYAQRRGIKEGKDEEFYHRKAKELIESENIEEAIKMAMMAEIHR